MHDESNRRLADWAVGMDALAGQFIELHNAFMQSLRFSIAGLFRKKDYGPLRQAVEKLLEQLDEAAAFIRDPDAPGMEATAPIVDDFREYAKCIRRTCEILWIIVHSLHDKVQGHIHYPTQAYVNDLRNYEGAVAHYLEVEARFRARTRELAALCGE